MGCGSRPCESHNSEFIDCLLNIGTCVCWDSVKDTSKASSKGITERLNVLMADVYKGVPQTQHSFTGINRGFTKKNRQMVMYGQPTTMPKDRSFRMVFLQPLLTSP